MSTDPGLRTGRPASAPAYYLGRPASIWLNMARRRPGRIVAAEGTRQQAGSRRPAA